MTGVHPIPMVRVNLKDDDIARERYHCLLISFGPSNGDGDDLDSHAAGLSMIERFGCSPSGSHTR